MAKAFPNPADQRRTGGDISALAHVTNIDRRQCKRVVPMKVLALGLSRTGTSSLRQALIDLGYTDCYHFCAPLQENVGDQSMWIEAYEAKFEGKGKVFDKADWDQLLGHCQAITDTPCVEFHEELLKAYPDAKVILTVRDSPERLFKSQMATIVPWYQDYCKPPSSLIGRVFRWFTPIDARAYRFMDLHFGNSEMWQRLLYDYQNETETVKQYYEQYNEKIKSMVPKERLLIMNVKEGWDPLCNFLEEEKPLYPFPRRNDTQIFKSHAVVFDSVFSQVVKWNVLKTVGAVAVVGLTLAVGAYRCGLWKKI